MNKRVLKLNSNSASGKSVLYVMSRDQRVNDNHALLEAQNYAIDANLELHVMFNVLESTGVRSQEHYQFMVAGLQEVERQLDELGIPFILTVGSPVKNVTRVADELDTKAVFFDLNPLRGPRAVQKKIATQSEAECYVVDSHNIIPLWVLSDKEEFAAHTIRNKVHKNLDEWLFEPAKLSKQAETKQSTGSATWDQVQQIVDSAQPNGNSIPWKPGEAAAQAELKTFIESRLPNYAEERNVPTLDQQSNLSPYLHFGHISALRIALEVAQQIDEPILLLQRGKLASYEGEPTLANSVNAFLEELIVRKELADNFCFYNPSYDSIDGAKPWGRESVEAHEEDKREYTYTRDEWEQAQTHDEPWNAAQQEMMKTGKMHGYMRMYWAKKILEWSESPQEAIETAVYLNDKYSIDGGDPNGYTGIMWSIVGIHDRPWFEREVFGKIRYMNRGGLERRFDVNEYIRMWT